MKAEIKQQWIDELRSGNYQQGQMRLKDVSEEAPRYCCLGVLCEISPAPREEVHTGTHSVVVGFGSPLNHTSLPRTVLDWSGPVGFGEFGTFDVLADDFIDWLRSRYTAHGLAGSENALYTVDYNGQVSLSGLNDHGVPFLIIADVIEKYIETED